MSLSIAFVTDGSSMLPGLSVYVDFFSRYVDVRTAIVSPKQISQTACDVEWHFMGSHVKRNKHRIVVHEYLSSSTPPLAGCKNWLKRTLNCIPDYRIFLTPFVKAAFNFKDGVPFGYRGHGININRQHDTVEKQYDFIYVGTVSSKRNMGALLNAFATGTMKDKTILLLSKNYERLKEVYAKHDNIVFKGPVPYLHVQEYIGKARYAINFMPDVYPYNQQVSSKMLDYISNGIPVVSSDYAWVRQFQQENGGAYFFLQPDLSNLTWEGVTSFPFAMPDVALQSWEEKIKAAGVLEFLTLKTGFALVEK